MNIYYLAGYLVILGALIAAATYFFYQKYLSGKVVVQIHTKDRVVYRKLVKPGPLGELHLDGNTYVYNENAISYTPTGLLRQLKPFLEYHQDNPAPIDVYNKSKRTGVSSAELSDMMNDQTVKDFVSAQSSIQPKQIITAVIAMGLAVIATIGVSTYYTMTDGEGLSRLIAGGG